MIVYILNQTMVKVDLSSGGLHKEDQQRENYKTSSNTRDIRDHTVSMLFSTPHKFYLNFLTHSFIKCSQSIFLAGAWLDGHKKTSN